MDLTPAWSFDRSSFEQNGGQHHGIAARNFASASARGLDDKQSLHSPKTRRACLRSKVSVQNNALHIQRPGLLTGLTHKVQVPDHALLGRTRGRTIGCMLNARTCHTCEFDTAALSMQTSQNRSCSLHCAF